MHHCSVLVTEDSDILNLNGTEEFADLLSTTNRKLKVQTLTETL
jgi:hypothetical protein